MSYQLTDANKHYIPNNNKLILPYVLRNEVEKILQILGLNVDSIPREKLNDLAKYIMATHSESDTTWKLYEKLWRLLGDMIPPSDGKCNTKVDGIQEHPAGTKTSYPLKIENELKSTFKWFSVPKSKPAPLYGRVNVSSLLIKLENGFDNLDIVVDIPNDLRAHFTVPYIALLKAHELYKRKEFIEGSVYIRKSKKNDLFEFFPNVKNLTNKKSVARLNSLFLEPFCTKLEYKNIHGKWVKEI